MRRVGFSRSDVWLADLDPTQGREQAGRRPCVIVSTDLFNRGPADLVVVVPITSRRKGIPLHVSLKSPEGGLKVDSYIKCEDIRSVSKNRLFRRLGAVSEPTMKQVEARLEMLLDLGSGRV